MEKDVITPEQAENYIDSFRMGIPPNQHLAHFTVGRQSEINVLVDLLNHPERRIKLLHANYGSGKTHLLKLLQEEGLKRNFAVSLLTLDAKSGVRFNRLDEIFGEVVRNMRFPSGDMGFAGLFRTTENSSPKRAMMMQGFYNNKHAPQLEQAIMWWVQYPQSHDAIIDWVTSPQSYTTSTQQEELYRRVLNKSYLSKTDRFNLAVLRREGRFKWIDVDNYNDISERIRDVFGGIYDLTQISGCRGLIVLIDEFEDVINNMNRRQQIIAFKNLFMFYRGFYPGLVVFAVTPDFINKCRELLNKKAIDDFNIESFERLPFLRITPLNEVDLSRFARKILQLYEIAYNLNTANFSKIDHQIQHICKNAFEHPISDRPRYIAKQTTQILDSYVE